MTAKKPRKASAGRKTAKKPAAKKARVRKEANPVEHVFDPAAFDIGPLPGSGVPSPLSYRTVV